MSRYRNNAFSNGYVLGIGYLTLVLFAIHAMALSGLLDGSVEEGWIIPGVVVVGFFGVMIATHKILERV